MVLQLCTTPEQCLVVFMFVFLVFFCFCCLCFVLDLCLVCTVVLQLHNSGAVFGNFRVCVSCVFVVCVFFLSGCSIGAHDREVLCARFA